MLPKIPFPLLFLLHLLIFSAAAATDFQFLNVKETKFDSNDDRILHNLNFSDGHRQVTGKKSNSSSSTKFKLKLVHRDKLPPSHVHGRRHGFVERMKRDASRVAALVRRLSHGGADSSYKAANFATDVISGMEEGSGEYFVRIGVGSPPRSQYMVIDSGSDIVWVQCQPCSQCYQQSDPVFDPADSASFTGVSCGSSLCDRLENDAGCHAGRCRYEVLYGDGSYTKGTLALETLTIGEVVVRDVAIGCGHTNQGMFIGAAGLLGLGGGSMSFVGQLGGQTGGAFSYCLVSRGSGSTGALEFGRGGPMVDSSRCEPHPEMREKKEVKRLSSLWPLLYGTSCCFIEFASLIGSRFDFDRYGLVITEARNSSTRSSYHMIDLGSSTES
ncbi:protein ASPARTIC PROTEASE IN GUARD CELL 2-like [Momordica charantia]|uniref:Protein ASPARTIC PROTEASE IN GUARD CELL 2-like n=1 Tax=Momordica charantia TaxID=3673 RepID=A0A6J1CBZ9_MOMCH|nr:protein ASPARTIC PROTEASE IN GUARD CELL 2-like [Momordica charantia]